MLDKKHKLILTLAATIFFSVTGAISAQEIGANLGGSTGVFRPKNPPTSASSAGAAKKNASKNASVKAKRAEQAAKSKLTKAAAGKELKNQAPARQANAAKSRRAKQPPINIEEVFETAIEQGNIERDERNFAAAEKAYLRALEAKPKDWRAHYGLGNIYADQQLWDEAEKRYRQAITLNTLNVEANIALSYVLVQPNRGGNVAERYVEAETAARRAITLDKQNAAAFDQLGVALEARGLIGTETENAYRRAIELNPNYPVAYAHLARLLRKNGRNKEAANAYAKAVELANDVTNLILVAEVLQTEQRYEDSEMLLRRVLTVDETNPPALFLLGRALLVKQNHADAEKFLKRSLAVSPRTFFPYTLLASLYLRTARYDEAEQTLLKAVPLASDTEGKQLAGALSLVGDGFLRQQKTQDALRVFSKARELDPENPQLNAKLNAIK